MSRTRAPRPAHPVRPLAARWAALLALLGLLLSASGASAVLLDCPCSADEAKARTHATPVDACDSVASVRPAAEHPDNDHPDPASAPACPCDCDCALACCNWIAMPADAPAGAAVLKPAPDRNAAPSLPPVDFVIDPAYPPPRA